MKIFGLNISRAKDAPPVSAPPPVATPAPFAPQPDQPAAPPTRQQNWLNPRWEPMNITRHATAIRIQTAIEQAENGETRELFRFYRDALLGDDHIQGEFSKRLLAVLGQPLSVLPDDKDNADDVAAAAAVKRMVKDCENWTDGVGALLASSLWPVAVAEKLFRPADQAAEGEPQLTWTLRRIEPVNPMLLCYRWAYLTGGIAMGTASPAQTSGLGGPVGDFLINLEKWEPFLKLWPIDGAGRIIYDASRAEYLDPRRHIVHRGHLLTQFKDNWGGPGRAIMGWWLLRVLGRDWFAQFMERYGMPFPVAKTDVKDEQSVQFLRDALKLSVKIGGLVIGHEDQVDLAEAMVAGGAEGQRLFLDTCNGAISHLIVGQDNSRAKPGGLNAGEEKLQTGVRDDLRLWDMKRIGETLVTQLARPFLDLNGLPGSVTLTWGGLSAEDAAATGELLVQLDQANLEPTDESIPVISERVGFQVQRKALPAPADPALDPATPPKTFSAAAPAAAAAQRAALAAVYKGAMAPVRKIVMESRDEADLMRKLKLFFADWPDVRIKTVCEEAMQIKAAAGAIAGAGKGAKA